jgi:glutamyl-tRNA synthetase
MSESFEDIARKYTLANAIQYGGKASTQAVLGKLFAQKPELKKDTEWAARKVKEIVREINSLSLKEQHKELERVAPESFEKKKEKKEKREIFLTELPDAVRGKVITRFPPEPNGCLHIGHAKAAILNYEYAKKYGGKFILRFDDTNPEKEEIGFYEAQKRDLRWLGVNWDMEYRTSENIPKHYSLAGKLIDQGDAYVCTCKPEQIKQNRFAEIECQCRKLSSEQNRDRWKEMFDMPEGSAVLRLKGNMHSKNTAMRDPMLFRLIDKPHPLQGNKYRVWPTYDFAGAVEDSLSGVTHAMRTKEYELRYEPYFYLLEKLNLRKPVMLEFSRLLLRGIPVSKRIIKKLIDEEKVKGWDDPRLSTLISLRRRGIQPIAIKQFVLSTGLSKVESEQSMENLISMNRKVLDPIAKRIFFVPEPWRVVVHGMDPEVLTLRFHPDYEMGNRILKVGRVLYIPEADASTLKRGDVIRLMGFCNLKIERVDQDIHAKYMGKQLEQGLKKIQWVPEKHEKIEVIDPKEIFEGGELNQDSLVVVKGYAEESVNKLNDGEIVQFERFGFCKIEKNNGIKGFVCG